MPRPHGLDHFRDYFKDFEEHYVIIGGMASSVNHDDAGAEFRVTKDIDLVILTNDHTPFLEAIVTYLYAGEYEEIEATETPPRYYRFTKPKLKEFPIILEIFSKNKTELKLRAGQKIIPLSAAEENNLSAILLDDEYFNIIKAGAKTTKEGYRITDTQTTISLKATAFREMKERKMAGEKIEDKKIDKHRNDVVRLALILSGEERLVLPASALEDVKSIIEQIELLSEPQLKDISGVKGVEKATIIDTLNVVFTKA